MCREFPSTCGWNLKRTLQFSTVTWIAFSQSGGLTISRSRINPSSQNPAWVAADRLSHFWFLSLNLLNLSGFAYWVLGLIHTWTITGGSMFQCGSTETFKCVPKNAGWTQVCHSVIRIIQYLFENPAIPSIEIFITEMTDSTKCRTHAQLPGHWKVGLLDASIMPHWFS